MEILVKTCLMPLALKTQNDSFAFVHELKQEMHADLKYVESLEDELDELESDKAEFSNMYDMLLQECVSKDVMCSYLQSSSDLDEITELQCLYLHKVRECDCLAQKLFEQTKLECEQYFEIQDLKAQLQDKNIAIYEHPGLYAITQDQSDPATRLIPDSEEILTLADESRSKLNKDLVKPFDYTKLNSLYEIFKPPTQHYEIQFAQANEIRKKMWRKSFVKTKPNVFKNIDFLPVSKSVSKSRQAYNVMTNNINHLSELVNQAWVKHSNDHLYLRHPTAQDMEILVKKCLMPLALKTQDDSLAFIHELKKEMHADLKYVESLEDELDELESDKAEFSNMYDMLLQECVSKDVMCSYLLTSSDLDEITELQCLYLHKVMECDCLAQKLSEQTDFVSKEIYTELLQRFARLEKHSISLEIALQECQVRLKNDTVCTEKASNVFRKEREQYVEIQDLKAQLQDKNMAISELKKLVAKCKGKSVDTKFDKPSVVRQPNAQRLPGNDLLTGNRGSDLYTISLQDPTSSTPICLMAKASPTQAWMLYKKTSKAWKCGIAQQCPSTYKWVPKTKMKWVPKVRNETVPKRDVVIGLPKLKYVKDQLCSSCEVSKAKRSSFKSKTVPSSKGRLNLLHMDLCGPMRVASINGKKYILVIVDDYSRYTWTLFLRSKDETPEVLKDFLTMIQRNLQALVISVRTDRGTEFLNKTLHAFFKEEGIEHQTSTPRTPEQNGVVERRNRTLVEAARTMLSASKLPLFFWAEAIATACYTQNRSIIIPTHEKTAYHIINDRKPSIKHLHIFGCTCYLTRDGENLDKMKEKGDPCILVGYSTQSKGYHVYNKRTRLK
ncbi:retrovirus-related pol polyprotein from transposon TNT 1-94 [Tanacetum coccineum]